MAKWDFRKPKYGLQLGKDFIVNPLQVYSGFPFHGNEIITV
jgi:hypothetical protein